MQYCKLLVFSAAIAMAVAAPVDKASALEAQLQRVLESASERNLLAAEESVLEDNQVSYDCSLGYHANME